MTATASNKVREEIIEKLGLRRPRVFVHGFNRPNISLRVDTFSSEEEKREAVLRRVEFAEKPGIVYASTHKNAELIAAELQERSVDAVFYHGGLKAKERDAIQDRFMSGDAPVIVATNAFGMGVDKPDVRFVYHADVSESLDAYYHEIGRAGRDGQSAEAVLFFCARDIGAQRYKTGSGLVDQDNLESVVNALAGDEGPTSREDLARETGLSTRSSAISCTNSKKQARRSRRRPVKLKSQTASLSRRSQRQLPDSSDFRKSCESCACNRCRNMRNAAPAVENIYYVISAMISQDPVAIAIAAMTFDRGSAHQGYQEAASSQARLVALNPALSMNVTSDCSVASLG